jgi:hydroxyacylglutathione hydrolase
VIYPVLSNSFESNTFIVVGDRACVIDPGINPRRVLSKFDEYNIEADILINTHCHFDHTGADAKVLELGGIKLGVHDRDATAIESGDDSLILASLFGRDTVKLTVDLKLKDGDVIDLGGVRLEVVHTPGHTPGSMCLYEPQNRSLFTGDTVFRDGLGRTDFPGSSRRDMKKSVERLVELHEKKGVSKIFPGHGHIGRGSDILRIYESFFGDD